MERLTHRDLRALLEFFRECYALHEFNDFVTGTLCGLQKLIPCLLASYDEMNPSKRTSVNWLDPPGSLTPRQERIWEQVMHEHPVLNHIVRRKDLRPHTMSDFLTLSQFHRLALYGEFYRTIGVEDGLCFALPFPPPRVIGIALHRNRRSFTERDRLLTNLVRPHLAQAWRNAKTLTRVEREMRLFGRALEELGRGVVLLGSSGRVQRITPAAREWMRSYFGSAPALSGRLPEPLARWFREQEKLLGGCDLPPVRTPLVVERDDARLEVRLVSGGGESLLLMQEVRARMDPPRLERLGLTRREAEVLAWVAEGKTNVEIAAILGASPRTVQKHLEHILQKLGVETRTAAAARALQASARLPDQPPAPPRLAKAA